MMDAHGLPVRTTSRPTDDVLRRSTPTPTIFNAVARRSGRTRATPSYPPQIEMVPQNYHKLDRPKSDITKMEKLLDMLEDDDDVQNVWHNWDED